MPGRDCRYAARISNINRFAIHYWRSLEAMARAMSLVVLVSMPAAAGPPFRTDDPETVDYQHWEMTLFSQGTRIAGSTGATLPGFEVNYGALPNLQLHAIVPLGYESRAGGPSGFGAGDLELGAKYRFLAPGDGDWFPQAGIFPTIEVPIGNQTFSASTGHAQIFLPLWLQKDFGRWSSYGGGGYWIDPGAGNRDFWFFGAALWRSVADNFRLGVEVFHQSVSVTAGNASTGANVGVVYDLSDNWHLLNSVGTGLQNRRTTNKFSWYAALQLTF
jgi:hypothetical protein